MRIPFTKYGLPQVAFFPAILILAMAICAFLPLPTVPFWIIQCVLLILLIWVFSFFRDPHREIPEGNDILISPADGKITDITVLDYDPYINGPTVRIGIFLSVFNVHINRMPCDVMVEKIVYKKGVFKNAISPGSAQVNESNDLYLTRINEPKDRLILRQISGAIARRIVCETSPGKQLTSGQQFGMIKFGSRTELYFPQNSQTLCLAKIGDKVKAGLTILVRYQQ